MVDPRRLLSLWRLVGRLGIGVLVAGLGLAAVGFVANSRSVSEPLTEAALLAALACGLAGVGLLGTIRIGVATFERTVGTPGERYAWVALQITLVTIATLWLVGLVVLLASAPHAVIDWPVEPGAVGTLVVYALGGLVVAPVGFGMVGLALVIAARGQGGDRAMGHNR